MEFFLQFLKLTRIAKKLTLAPLPLLYLLEYCKRSKNYVRKINFRILKGANFANPSFMMLFWCLANIIFGSQNKLHSKLKMKK